MRRIPATHLLVFMISPESRDKKPYAIPVQCIPYSGMSENTIRDLANHLIAEMTSRGMKVAGMFCMGIFSAGMVTNGEHNGLRMRGNTWPLHVLQLRAEAKAKSSKTSVKSLLAMLSPTGFFLLFAFVT